MLFFWHGLANVKWSNLYVVWTQECLCVWHPPRWGELIFANKLLLYHVLKHSLGIFETLKILLQKVFKALISKKKKSFLLATADQYNSEKKHKVVYPTSPLLVHSTATLINTCLHLQTEGPLLLLSSEPQLFQNCTLRVLGKAVCKQKGIINSKKPNNASFWFSADSAMVSKP